MTFIRGTQTRTTEVSQYNVGRVELEPTETRRNDGREKDLKEPRIGLGLDSVDDIIDRHAE